MNGVLKIISALAAVSFTGCQKSEHLQFAEQEQVKASIEGFETVTRTAMTTGNKIVWSKGDCLAVFNGNSHASKYQVADECAGYGEGVFNLIDAAVDDSVAGSDLSFKVALYPYLDALSLSVAYNIEGVVLPHIQSYAKDSFASGVFLMLAVTKVQNGLDFHFKNVLGAIKLQFKGTQVVKSIKVEGTNGEKLSGAATLTAYANNLAPSINMVGSDDACKSVTLDCGDGVQLSESEVTNFIIALPPVSFGTGFIVSITDTNEQIYTFAANTANDVLRSSILVMPEVTLGKVSDEGGNPGDYIDEYGVNHGQGVNIDGVVWAPVNCGYHKTDYKWGKMYQWGRKCGQGFSGILYDINGNVVDEISDASTPELVEGTVTERESNVFYYGSIDWLTTRNDKLWNSGSDSEPVKTQNDPCPKGWRVPTYAELSNLCKKHSAWTTSETNMPGYWFSGSSPYSETAPQIFLPAAGYRGYMQANTENRGLNGYYWSSKPYARKPDYMGGGLSFGSTSASMHYYGRAGGYSVRCVLE